MVAIWSGRSEPWSSAAAFSWTWATVRNPGMGIVCGLRAHNHASDPCASVRPPEVRTSRTAATRSNHVASGRPSVKYCIHSGA